jgi:hypothetical protein
MTVFQKKNINPILTRLLTILASLLLGLSPALVSAQSLQNPIPWIPPVGNISIAGGVAGTRSLLSVGANGSYTDLYSTDDNSGRQRWTFQRSADGSSYNILVGGGTPVNRKYLSVTSDGSKVGLLGSDDGSGRQRWLVENIGAGFVRIRSAGGISNNRKYLSVSADGGTVDLFGTDDNSGRQRWNIRSSR